jgi:PhnB protein
VLNAFYDKERKSMLKISPLSRRQFVASAVAVAASPTTQAEISPGKGAPMTSLSLYLLFDGTCYEAMHFYQSVFGGELTMMKVSESPAKDHMPAFQLNKVINARLKSATVEISASDWLMPNRTPVRGNTVCLYLSGGAFAELKTLFDKLSEGAEVTDPLKEMFFGTYGALNDKFGNRWMFHANREQA